MLVLRSRGVLSRPLNLGQHTIQELDMCVDTHDNDAHRMLCPVVLK